MKSLFYYENVSASNIKHFNQWRLNSEEGIHSHTILLFNFA